MYACCLSLKKMYLLEDWGEGRRKQDEALKKGRGGRSMRKLGTPVSLWEQIDQCESAHISASSQF